MTIFCVLAAGVNMEAGQDQKLQEPFCLILKATSLGQLLTILKLE